MQKKEDMNTSFKLDTNENQQNMSENVNDLLTGHQVLNAIERLDEKFKPSNSKSDQGS